MPPPPDDSLSSSGINVGNVSGNVSIHAEGDIVAGPKIIQISVEAVTQRELITTSPYRGLDYFEEGDKELFFGRDQLIESLLAQLKATNVLLVLGASGSGKSSVVRAGLLPKRKDSLGARFRSFALFPDKNPFLSLRSALQGRPFSQAQTRELLDAQADVPNRLIRGLQQNGEEWLIFVDQFEEVFAVSDERLRTSFISALLKIAQDPSGSIKLVLAMRGDFFDRLSPFPEFAKLIEKNIVLVADMQVDELRLAIEQPAAQHGVVFQQGLVEEIIKDVQGQAGSLPLLQYTLNMLWQEEERRNALANRHLYTQIYRELGGVRGALQKRAEGIYASFGDGADPKGESAKQKIVRQIFLRVLYLAGQGSDEGTWRPVRRRVAKAFCKTAEEQEVLQKLVDEKLLVSSGGQGADATVEVAHEALFTSWERLKQWIEAGKQVIFVRNRLADDARRWQSRCKEDTVGAEEELLGGSRLAQALEMRARGDFDTVFGSLSESEKQFVNASEALRVQRIQEEQERAAREVEVAQKLLETERKRAEDARAANKKASEVASRGAVLLARYFKDSGKNPQALARLAQALRLNPDNTEASTLAAAMLIQLSWNIPSADYQDRKHDALVISAQFSPDAKRFLTIFDDGTARLWIVATGKPLSEVIRDEGAIRFAQFSPDGQRVVTISRDSMARLRDGFSGEPLGEPLKHGTHIYSAQFSPDGRRVVTLSDDNKGRLWDAASGKPIGKPMKYKDGFYSAQFSPDSHRVMTLSWPDMARLWDVESGKPVGRPMRHRDVDSAQFSPDGQRVLTAGRRNKTALLWDATSGRRLGKSLTHGGYVSSVQFSPDGRRAVTSSADNTARLWDGISGKPLGESMKHGGLVFSAQFSPDGQRVVTASDDETAQLWDAATGKALGEPMKHKGPVFSAQFSPDGQRVMTASWDSTVRLWDSASSKPIGEPLKHEDGVHSAQFSPDDKLLMTVSGSGVVRLWYSRSSKSLVEPIKYEGDVTPQGLGPQPASAQFSPDGGRMVISTGYATACLWDPVSGKPVGEPMQHQEAIASPQFSPDGARVLTGSMDCTARLWDADTGKPIGEPLLHEDFTRDTRTGELTDRTFKDFVYPQQFSADGQWILTIAAGSAWLWDAFTGRRVGELKRHVWKEPFYGRIHSARFSPDSRRIITGAADGTARLWDVPAGELIAEFADHKAEVYSAHFSPDGQRVVTASWDKTARLWDAASGKPVGQPMKHEQGVGEARFSPDGRRVVTASADNTARLWDAATGKPLGEPMKHGGAVRSAEFSRDGKRIVTASDDGTARVWDTTTGEPLGEPMEHQHPVHSAQFSPDGQRVVTASKDNTVRLWDAVTVTDTDTEEDILLFASLAEASGGMRVDIVGSAETLRVLSSKERLAIRETITAKFAPTCSELTPLRRCLKWSISDHKTRAISPMSRETMSEWLENRIREATVEGLRRAMQVDPANARITAHLGRALAERSLNEGTHPEEARRAHGEADFLTSHALKLAPDSDEVKELRDEVVKLLELKTE